MTEAQANRHLYLTDPYRWYEQAAPKVLARLRSSSKAEQQRIIAASPEPLKQLMRELKNVQASHS